ncbi:Tyrosinase [Neolecta irregularis DAH-3]|uniref:tyrosinase n=1 Tax=Neolecta irregularis (strain DAH-3) TaxID=1198029 RepID=A0A1U7LR42_NEOID|nr:Tyrosinase [Neolecta irregularis DAH-3]|eukprot:OLL25127.1 Tyrosinase [Neolecta irregularis DAH-3]
MGDHETHNHLLSPSKLPIFLSIMTSSAYNYITGVPVKGIARGFPPARQEIHDFVKDGDVMNLFLLANAELQNTDQSKTTSWFQISGLYGRPYVTWENAPISDIDQTQSQGYCKHGTPLLYDASVFPNADRSPIWHCPYVCLYEQVICKIAQRIAGEFPSTIRSRWVEAASRMRCPFFDWALDTTLPDIYLRNKTVQVETPTGRSMITNPLFSFRFLSVPAEFGEDGVEWIKWRQTLRAPSDGSENAQSQPGRVAAALKSIQHNIRDRTYALLTYVNSFEVMSNHSWTESHPGSHDSLESIHDIIHNTIGQAGHFAYPDFAAFDPIFWIQHAQIDRLFRMWQAINPTIWITSESDNAPLLPFRKNEDEFWVSETAREWKQLGYTYPDFVLAGTQSSLSLQKYMRDRVNDLYGLSFDKSPIVTTTGSPKTGFVEQGSSARNGKMPPLRRKKNPVASRCKSIFSFEGKVNTFEWRSKSRVLDKLPGVPVGYNFRGERNLASHHISSQILQLTIPDNKINDDDSSDSIQTRTLSHNSNGYREWIVNVRILKYAIEGSFSVFIFLGSVPDDPSNWPFAETMVGLHANFANKSTSRCGNCEIQRNGNLVTSGTIPLRRALIEAGIDLDSEQVEPYLRRNLQWRVQHLKVDGSVIHKIHVPSLRVSVASAWVSYRNDPELGYRVPYREDWKYHHLVTRDRRGGVRSEDYEVISNC